MCVQNSYRVPLCFVQVRVADRRQVTWRIGGRCCSHLRQRQGKEEVGLQDMPFDFNIFCHCMGWKPAAATCVCVCVSRWAEHLRTSRVPPPMQQGSPHESSNIEDSTHATRRPGRRLLYIRHPCDCRGRVESAGRKWRRMMTPAGC